MSDKPDPRDPMPVTAEVGGEGGSFADETYQEAEQQGDRGPGLPRIDSPQAEPPDIRSPETHPPRPDSNPERH